MAIFSDSDFSAAHETIDDDDEFNELAKGSEESKAPGSGKKPPPKFTPKACGGGKYANPREASSFIRPRPSHLELRWSRDGAATHIRRGRTT